MTLLAGPIDEATVDAVPGHVDALGDLTLSVEVPEPPSYEDLILSDTPSLYWRLGASGITDLSGNGRNGTAQGGVTVGGAAGLLTDDADAATDFVGDQYVTSAYTVYVNGSVRTFEIWAWRDTNTAEDMLFGSTSGGMVCGLRIEAGNSDVQWFTDTALGVTWAGAWPGTGQRVHCVLTFDETTNVAELFINGASVGTRSQTAPYGGGVGTFQVSGYDSVGTPFDGKLDEAAVYERALTPAEVLEHYELGAGLVEGLPARDYIEYGLEFPASDAPLLLDGDTLEAVGGSADTEAGSYSTNIIRATLTTTPLVICSTGSQPHAGRWRHALRALADAEDVRLRLSWRVGDGPWQSERWVTWPGADEWFELDLELTDIAEVPAGDHSWEGRIEGYAQSPGDEVAIDFTRHVPAYRWGRMRKPPAESVVSTGISAYDAFDDAAYTGALTGEVAPLGGTWSGDGDADDFTQDTTNLWTQRTANSDSAVTNGRYARLGTATPTGVSVQADVKAALNLATIAENRLGVFARYVGVNDWLMAVMRVWESPTFLTHRYVTLYKRVAGTVTKLGEVEITRTGSQISYDWRTIRLAADADGNVVAYEGAQGGSLSELISVTEDADLATGGALEDGGYGIYDANTATSGTHTRRVHNFQVSEPSASEAVADHVLWPDQSAKFLHDTALRENEAGTRFGRVPLFEGQHLRVPPATRAGRVSRLVIVERELDIASEQPSQGLENEVTAELAVTPRVVLTGRT